MKYTKLITLMSVALAMLVILTGLAPARARAQETTPLEDYVKLFMYLDYENDMRPYPGETVTLTIYCYATDAAYFDSHAPKTLSALENARLKVFATRTSGDITQTIDICETPLNTRLDEAWIDWTIPEEFKAGDTLAFTVRALSADGETLLEDREETKLDYMAITQDLYLGDFTPYSGERITSLGEAATLGFTEDLPVIDGATGMVPVYAAFAQAVYTQEQLFQNGKSSNYWQDTEYLRCTTTSGAYKSLIEGDADIIFVAQPSAAQFALAEEEGVKMRLTPIGYEAFVFIVNEQNPIDGLTVDQIIGVYSGEITDWAELGVPAPGKITAYQRARNSGSQTALEELMGDIPLMEPPTEERLGGMMDVITGLATYRNSQTALGYSFRYYITTLQQAPVKLLKLNGVYPSEENIANGAYPVISTLYAVTREGDETENTKKLLEWVTGEQGQTIIKKVGYTPIMQITLPESAEDTPKAKPESTKLYATPGEVEREGTLKRLALQTVVKSATVISPIIDNAYLVTTDLIASRERLVPELITPEALSILKNATLSVHIEYRSIGDAEGELRKVHMYEGPLPIGITGVAQAFMAPEDIDLKTGIKAYAVLADKAGNVLLTDERRYKKY